MTGKIQKQSLLGFCGINLKFFCPIISRQQQQINAAIISKWLYELFYRMLLADLLSRFELWRSGASTHDLLRKINPT
jgi:hypothetical protein